MISDLAAMPLVRERLKLLSEAPAMMAYLYRQPELPAAEEFIPKKKDLAAAIAMLKENLSLVGSTDFSVIEAAENRFKERSVEIGAKLGDLLMPLRVAITGSRVSPPLFESIRILGAEASAARIEAAPVLQLETAVVAEEIRRADGLVGAGHRLGFVVEVGEREAHLLRHEAHVVEAVLGVARGVVGRDGDDVHTLGCQVLGVP